MGGLGLVAGIAGSAVAGKISAQKNKEADAMLQQQKSDNEDWYNLKRSEDLTRRADVVAMTNKNRKMLEDRYKSSRAANIVSGGTDESLALQQQAANQAMADSMSNIAIEGVREKQNAEQQYIQRKNSLEEQEYQKRVEQAKAAAAAGAQMASAGINAAGNALSVSKLIK